MAKTINVDVIDKSVAPKNPVNICIVNKPNPAKNCTVTESQLYRLINIPSYWVYEAGTTNIITGKNFEKYFPSSSGGGTGSGLTLGETNTTAYRGDRGKIAYNHSQLTAGNPHGVTKTDVGLDKVDNTSDADKPISTLQQAEFDKKLNIDKAVGKNVAGQEFTVAYEKVTADKGAEIFNNYLDNIATGKYSHAEGDITRATNYCDHAEGLGTKAKGGHSHAEGNGSYAAGDSSHSEGYYTLSGGDASHSEGSGTKATGEAQHVEGKYNIEDTENKFAHIIGNGTDNDNRSNAFAIDWYGNIYVNNSPSGVNVNDLQKASHTHSNKEIIDKLSVDESGKLLYDGNPISSGGGTGSANNNYQNLENKPSINGVELIGNKTTADLNIVSEKASETVSGTSKMWTTVDETTSKVTLHISTE